MSDESRQVAGKVVVITGAGCGIGGNRPAAGSRGARVVLGSRSEEELAATAGAIVGSGGEVAYQCIDVTQPQDLRALAGLAARRFGRLDVLARMSSTWRAACRSCCTSRLRHPTASRA